MIDSIHCRQALVEYTGNGQTLYGNIIYSYLLVDILST